MWVAKNKGWPNKTFSHTFYLAHFFASKKCWSKQLLVPNIIGKIFFCVQKIFFLAKKKSSKIYCLVKKNSLANIFLATNKLLHFFVIFFNHYHKTKQKLYWCNYPHTPRDSVSTVCGIFFFKSNFVPPLNLSWPGTPTSYKHFLLDITDTSNNDYMQDKKLCEESYLCLKNEPKTCENYDPSLPPLHKVWYPPCKDDCAPYCR